MDVDRIEELLLLIVAACMLSYLLPFSLARNIIVTLVIAAALIGLIVLRSRAWHRGERTPFDSIILVGIIVAILYLLTFYAFNHTIISGLVVMLFAILFALAAAFLWQYRSDAFAPTPAVTSDVVRQRTIERHGDTRVVKTKTLARTSAVSDRVSDHAHDPSFRRGLDPIVEQEPPKSWFRRLHAPIARMRTRMRERRDARKAAREEFRHGLEPIPERHVPATKLPDHKLTPQRKEHIREELFRRGMEPIHEMHPPTPGKKHDSAFVRGVEPVTELRAPRPGKRHPAEFAKGIKPLHPVEDTLSNADLKKLERMINKDAERLASKRRK